MVTKSAGIIALPEADTWLLVKLRHLLVPSYLNKVDQSLHSSCSVNWHWQRLLWNFFAWLGQVFSRMHKRDNKQGLREAFREHSETKSLINWLRKTETFQQLWAELPRFLRRTFMVRQFIPITRITFHLVLLVKVISQTCCSCFKYPHICCLCLVFHPVHPVQLPFLNFDKGSCWSLPIQPSPHYDRFFYRLILNSLSHYSSISSHPIFDCQSRTVAQSLWASAAHYARGIHTQTF